MKIIIKSTCVIILLFVAQWEVQSQSNRFLQLDINAGIATPILGFKSQHMFAGNGYSAGGGFDYFFGKFGLGFNTGYFTNPTSQSFSKYISNKFLDDIAFTNLENWKILYSMIGPIYKKSYKKFEFDLFARGGYSQIMVPELIYNKSFYNQTYNLYSFSGATPDWQIAWSAGARIIYKLKNWFGIQAKFDYFTTSYVSKIDYNNTFRDATDGNKNGKMDDAEYFESQRITNKGFTDLNVLNINVGLVFQLDRKVKEAAAQMIPQEAGLIDEEVTPAIVDETQSAPLDEVKIIAPDQAEKIITREEIPLVNANEVAIREDSTSTENMSEVITIPATTYDAPESKYDEEAAEFLYKAGESYFATNDFENALPCFNKLKADPKYPRAKYMFALSLCAMGNCKEAKKEYSEFSKIYKGDDARTLEIIFASHSERCKLSGKLPIPSNNTKQVKNISSSESPSVSGKVYKIQFIAMKKSNAVFPRIANVGNIDTEFFPNKSVFRYTLGGYDDLNGAVQDVYKVRKLGFRDAFIAVYEQGFRINTLYHAK